MLGAGLILNRELMFDGGLDYGPLSSNLVIVVAYITAMQSLMLIWFHLRGGFREIVLMGLIVLSAAFGMAFYANVNQIPLNKLVWLVGAVFGAIQISYGLLNLVRRNQFVAH